MIMIMIINSGRENSLSSGFLFEAFHEITSAEVATALGCFLSFFFSFSFCSCLLYTYPVLGLVFVFAPLEGYRECKDIPTVVVEQLKNAALEG